MKTQTHLFQLLASLMFVLASGSFLQAQELKMKRQTTGAAGSSAEISLADNQWLVQQSVGQASVIGSARSGNRQLRQGFIQSDFSLSAIAESTSLSVTLFPNPFDAQFYIRFDEAVDAEVHVDVVDLSGRAVFQEHFAPAQQLNIRFREVAPGVYIIRIQSGTKHFTGRIQKLKL